MVSVNNITTQSQSLLLTTVSGSPSTSSLSPLSSPSTSKKMSQRESRHVHVCGLSDSVTDDRINTFFSTFGRVQKVEKVSDGFIVSFMDVRSAQKAHAADHRLDSGQTFRIAFHDHSKSNSMTTGGTVPSGSSCTNSPRAVSSTETPAASSFRSSSPQRSKDHRTPQPPRFSSSVSTSSVKRTSSRPENHHRRSETGFGKCSPVEGSGGGTNGCSGSGTTGGGGGSTHQGLQGVYVDRLPPRGELTLKEAIRETMKKHGRVVDVHFEGVGEERRALVVFQRVLDMDKLLAESPVPLLNARVRIRLASHVAVTEAYNQYLMQNSATASGLSLPSESSMNLSSTSQQDLPAKYAHHNGRDKNEVNVFNMKASRTLYVGGLESRISDDTLRRRFKQFGSILDVDVKNYESPSPFAFIQFADIDSAVRAINFHATQPCANKKGKKFQPNFGRSMTTSKLWVGGIPSSASEEYVAQKLRALSDGVTDVIFDAKVHQALVICSTTEQAQQALQKIRNGIPKQFVFKDGSGCEVKVPADYCSDRLHDFFVDRKHQSSSSSSSILSAPSSSLPLSYLSVAGVSHQSLDQGGALSPVLAPPPDPPSQLHGDMPSYVSRDHYRTDSRRSDSRGSRRREKSRERRGASPQQRHRSGGNGGRRPTHQRRQRSPRRMSGSSSDSDSSRGSSRSSSSDSRDSLRYRSRDKEKEREREKQKNGGAKKEKELTKTTRIATPPPQPPTILGVGGGGGKKRREEEERVQISSEADDKKDVPLIDPKHTVVPNDRDVKEQQVLEEPPPPPPLPPPPLDPVPSTSSHAVSMKDPMKVEVKEEPQPTITTIPSFHRTPPSQKNDVIIHPPPPTPTQKPQTGSVNSLSSNTQQPAPPIVKRPSTESYLFSSQPHHVVNPDRLPRWPGAEVGEVMRRHITVPTELNPNVKDPRLNHESTRPPGRTDLKVPFFATIFWTHKGTVPLDIRKHSSSSGCGGMVERKGSKPGAPRTPVRSAQHSRHGSISGASEHESLSRRLSGAYTPPGGLEWEGITVHQSALDRTRSSSGSEEDEDEGQCSPIEPPKPSSLDFIVNSNDDEKHAAEADLLQQMDELTKRFETVEDTFKATKEESVMRSAQVVSLKPAVPEKQTPIDIESELERLMDLNKQSTVAKLNIKVDPEKMKSVSSRSFDPMTSILMGAVHRPSEPSTSSGFSKPPLSISIPPPSNTSGVHSAVSTPGSAAIQSPRLSRKPSAPTPAHISASSIRVPPPSSSSILPPPPPTPSTGVSPPHPSSASSSLPFPPNFSVPPPLFTHSASLSPSSVAREPILSAPPQPPPMPQPSSTSLRRDSTSSLPPAPSTPRTLSPPPPPASRSGVTVPSMVSTPKSHRSDRGEAANTGAYKNKTPAPINRDSKSARHESFSGTARTPTTPFPPPTSVQRSMSMTDPKAKPNTPIMSRDATNEMLDKLFKNKTGISADIKKLPRIEKKVPPPGSAEPQQASTSRDKPPREKERSGEHREKEKKHHKEGREHREHKEHKEHREKLRRKEDGTYETKEERAKRKEHERARKEKEDRREKDERKARKKAEKEKARQLQADAERKAREKKSKSKKKKKRNSGSEDSSADSAESDDEYTKSVKLARLLEAALPIGGSMYDRVKRRSSGLNKDDAEKKKTLEMLREKANKKKKKRVAHLSSSEEEDRDEDDEEEMEDEEKKDTDQSSSDEAAEEQHKHRKTSKSDKKKLSKQSRHDLSSSGPESGDSEGDEQRAEKQSAKRKKKKKEKKQSNFDLDDVFNADSSNDESTQPGPSSLFNEREKSERRERESREKETTKKEKKMKKHRMQESSDGSDREGQQKKKMKMENLFGSVEHKKEKKEKKREKKEKEREERKRMIERVEELHAKRRKKNSEQGTTDDSVTPKRPTTPPHLTSTTTLTLTTTPTSSTTPRAKREETSRGRETSQQPPAMVQQIQVDEIKRERSCDPVVHRPSSDALLSPRLNGPETTTVFGTVTGTVPVPKTSPMCSPVIKEKEPVVVPKVERASPARRSLTPPRAIPSTTNTSTTPAVAKADERPKLMTKAAMKVFVPSQNVATSMVPAVPAPSSAQPTSVEPPTIPSSVKPTVTPTVPPTTQSTATAVTTSSAAVKTSEAAVVDRHLSSDSEDDDFGPLTTAVAQNPVPNPVGIQNDAVGWSSEDAGSSSDSDVERQLLNRMNATGPELVDATRQFEQEPVTAPEPSVTVTPTVTKREPEITFSMTPERIPEVVPDLCVSTSLPSAHSPLVRDEEIESAVTGIVTQEHDEETSNAVDSIAIFDDEDEPEPEYPSQDFINQVELPLECDRVAEEEAQRAADALEMMDTDRHSSSGDEADVERVHAQRREQEVSHLSSQQPHFDTSSVSAGVVTASADVSMESPIRKPPSPIPEHQLNHGAMIVAPPIHTPKEEELVQAPAAVVPVTTPTVAFSSPTIVSPTTSTTSTLPTTPSRTTPVLTPTVDKPMFPTTYPPPAPSTPITSPLPPKGSSMPTNPFAALAVSSSGGLAVPTIQSSVPAVSPGVQSASSSQFGMASHQQFGLPTPSTVTSSVAAPMTLSSPRFTQPPRIDVDQPAQSTTVPQQPLQYASPRAKSMMASPSVPSATTPTTSHIQAVYNPYASLGTEQPTPSTTTAAPMFSMPTSASVIQQQQQQHLKPLASPQQRSSSVASTSSQPQQMPSAVQLPPVTQMGGLTQGIPLQQQQQLLFYQQQQQQQMQRKQQPATPSPAPSASPVVSAAVAQHQQLQQQQQHQIQHMQQAMELWKQMQQRPEMFAQRPDLILQLQLYMQNPLYLHQIQQQALAASAAAMQRQTASPASSSSRLHSPHPSSTPTMTQQQQQQQLLKKQQQEAYFAQAKAQQQREQQLQAQQLKQREQQQREQQQREQQQREQQQREQQQQQRERELQREREQQIANQRLLAVFQQQQQYQQQQQLAAAMVAVTSQAQASQHQLAAAHQASQLAAAQQAHQQMLQQVQAHQQQQQQQQQQQVVPVPATASVVEKKAPLPQQPRAAEQAPVADAAPAVVAQAAQQPQPAAQPALAAPVAPPAPAAAPVAAPPVAVVAPAAPVAATTSGAEGVENHPPLQEATNQDRSKNERFPVIWQGQLAMKNQEATVQFHMVAGVGDLVLKSLGNTKEGPTQHVKRVVRINQRMRLEPSQLQTVMGKLNGQSPFACMICLPCGENREVFQCNAQTFKTAFVDYFTQKQAAGIANIPERELTQSCLVHIFPPGPFPAQYLEYFSPELFQNIKQKDASYLFIVLTPEERVAA